MLFRSGGAAGVTRTIDILREELDNAMALLGQRRFVDVDRLALVGAEGQRRAVQPNVALPADEVDRR